jgi:hypothetical protein
LVETCFSYEYKPGVHKSWVPGWHHHHHHPHHVSVTELGYLLIRSGLTYPEVSSKVCHDSFCQSGSSVSLPWVIYCEAWCQVDVATKCCMVTPNLILMEHCMKYSSCHNSGTENFDVAPRFLENFCSSTLHQILYKLLEYKSTGRRETQKVMQRQILNMEKSRMV